MAKKSNETENTFKVKGEDLLKEIKKIVHEGNVRKIVIKDEKGKNIYLEIPVTVGVIGTLLLPGLAAIGALAAMLDYVTVELVKTETKVASKTPKAKKKS